MEPKVQRHLSFLYLSKTPVPQFFELIAKNLKCELDEELQEEFARCTFDHRLARRYPLSRSYRLAFLKQLMKHLEAQQQDIGELVYEEYTSLMAGPDRQRKAFVGEDAEDEEDDCYYVTRLIQDKYVVTKQSDAIVQSGTTGLRFWEGGLQLFEQIFVNRHLFKGKKMLELGAGAGFTGIAVSKFCELSGYIFTDHHYRVFQLLKENLRLNGFNSSDLVPTDKKLNKFYETADDEGNVSIKYYEKGEKGQEPFERFDNETSYFLDKGAHSVEKLSGEQLIEKSLNFDQKVNDLSEKLCSFEDFLDNFKEKLTIIDEKLQTTFDLGGSRLGGDPRMITEKEADATEDDGDAENENLNKNVVVCELDWTWEEDEIRQKVETYAPDYIVGADIVFDPDLIPDLVKVLKVALNALPQLQVLLVCTVRNEQTLRVFEDQLERLQRYQDIEFEKTQLSPRFTLFKHLSTNQPFMLYNIHNAKE